MSQNSGSELFNRLAAQQADRNLGTGSYQRSQQMIQRKQAQLQQSSARTSQALEAASARQEIQVPDAVASFGVGSNILLQSVGTLMGLATGNMDNAMRQQGERGMEYWEDRRSQEMVNRRHGRDQKVAQADGTLEQFGTAFWESLKDPMLLSDLVLEQLPNLALTGVGGRAAGAAAGAVSKGARNAAATTGAVATNASLQGGGIADQVYTDLLDLPQPIWEQHPEFQRIRGEIGDEEAKKHLALGQARKAALAAGMSSAASQRLVPGGLILDRALAGSGRTAGNLATRLAKGVAGEGLQEIVEEGSAQTMGNLMKAEINPEQDLMEGVGEAAGIAAAAGGTIGGAAGMGTPTRRDREKKAKQFNQVGAFSNAVETGDFTGLTDPKSPNRDHGLAARAARDRAMNQDLPAEERQKARDQVNRSAQALEAELSELQESLGVVQGQTQRDLDKDIDRAKQMLEKVPESETADREGLTNYIQQLEETKREIDGRKDSTAKKEKGLKAEIKKVQERLKPVHQWRQEVTGQRPAPNTQQQTEPEGGEATVQTTDEQGTAEQWASEQTTEQESDPATREWAQNYVRLAMSEGTVSAEDARAQAADTNNALTQNERTYLNRYSEAQAALHEAKGREGVNNDIYAGGTGYRGLPQYASGMQVAVESENTAAADRLVREIERFEHTRQGKAQAMRTAYDAVKDSNDGQYVMRDDESPTGWTVLDEKPQGRSREGQGDIKVTRASTNLLANVEAEAKAVGAVAEQMRAARRLIGQEQGTPASDSGFRTQVARDLFDQYVTPREAPARSQPDAATAPAQPQRAVGPNNEFSNEVKGWRAETDVGEFGMVTANPHLLPNNVREITPELVNEAVESYYNGEALESLSVAALDALLEKEQAKHKKGSEMPFSTPESEANLDLVAGLILAIENELSKPGRDTEGTTETTQETQSETTGQQPAPEPTQTEATQEAVEETTQEDDAPVDDETPPEPVTRVEVAKSGKPFKSEKGARASQVFKANENAEVVPVDGGFGVQLVTEQEQSDASGPDQRTIEQDTENTTEGEFEDGGLSFLVQEGHRDGPISPEEMGTVNALTAYFRQSPGKKGDRSWRPLVVVKDFFTKLKNDPSLIHQFLADPEGDGNSTALTSKQGQLINMLNKYMFGTKGVARNADGVPQNWSNLIDQNALLNPNGREFDHNNYMNFFLREGPLPENVKTAIALGTLQYVLEEGGKNGINNKKTINAMFGRDEDAPVSARLRALLHDSGNREALVVRAMGRIAADALGMQAVRTAPREVQAEFEMALGAQSLALGLQSGLLTEKQHSSDKLVRAGLKIPTKFGGESAATITGTQYFIHPTRQKAKKPKQRGVLPVVPQVQTVLDTARGSGSILTKVFGVADGLNAPTTRKQNFIQKFTKGTFQAIPKAMIPAMQKLAGYSYVIKGDQRRLRMAMTKEDFLLLHGFDPMTDRPMHIELEKAQIAKNEALEREYDRLISFEQALDENGGEGGWRQMFHLMPSVWRQQRVGYTSNMVNPQTSKLQRHQVSMTDWQNTVDVTDQSAKNTRYFKLAVMQALGYKTDKEFIDSAITDFDTLIQDPVVEAALEGMQNILNRTEDGIDASEMQAIWDAQSRMPGKGDGFLDGLANMARYAEAKHTGAPFETDIMYEVDGVTNGPALTHMLLGVIGPENARRFGFYAETDEQNNFVQWRKLDGSRDLYENLAEATMATLREIQKRFTPQQKKAMSALNEFMGAFVIEDGLGGKERGWIKQPLTAMIFGSNTSNAVDSMIDDLIDQIYTQLSDAAVDVLGDSTTQTIDRINTLLEMGGLDSNQLWNRQMGSEAALQRGFNQQEIKAMENAFSQTLGAAIETTLQDQFGEVIARRKELNRAAQTAFHLYNSAYELMRDQKLDQNVAEGRVLKSQKGIRQDLTQAEEQAIHEELGKLFPLVHTALSVRDQDLWAGLFAAKDQPQLASSDQAMHRQRVKYGSEIPTNAPHGSKQSFSVKGFAALRSGNVDPGVAMVILLTHALDSAIAMDVYGQMPALHVHDAEGVGINRIEEVGRALNKSTFTNLRDYSMPMEISDMLGRSLEGLREFVRNNERGQDLVNALPRALKATKLWGKNGERMAESFDAAVQIVSDEADAFRRKAIKYEIEKLEGMLTIKSVDQYSFENGNWVVSNAERTKVQEKLDGLRTQLDDEGPVRETPERKPPRTAQESPWGLIGRSSTISDPVLEARLKKGDVKAKDMFGLLNKRLNETERDPRTRDFRRGLLAAIRKTMDPNTPVRLITPDSPTTDYTGEAQMDRGWYMVSDGEIFVKSSAFEASGVNAETLLHEFTHAATAQFINNNPDHPAVQDLHRLRDAAETYVQRNAILNSDAALSNTDYAAALSSTHEMVAWGMTNTGFQNDVLSKVRMDSDASQRTQESGMRKFIRSLVKIFYQGREGISQANETGMGILIANVSLMFEASNKAQQKRQEESQADQHTPDPVGQQRYSQRGPDPMAFSSDQVFEALANVSNRRPSGTHAQHLRAVLANVVQTAYGAFEGDKAPAERRTAASPEDSYLQSLASGEMPFVSDAEGMLNLSLQESFVLESAEVTLREGMNASPVARRELLKLLRDAEAQIRPRDLYQGNWDQASSQERARAEQIHDFIFRRDKNRDGSTDFLSRFAAIGLTYEPLLNQLSRVQSSAEPTNTQSNTLGGRLMAWFNSVVSRIRAAALNVDSRADGQTRIKQVAARMASVEGRRKQVLVRKQTKAENILERSIRQGSESVRNTVERVGKSDFLTKGTSPFIAAPAQLASAVAGERGGMIMDKMMELRNKTFKQKYGFIASAIAEVRGPQENFQLLLRMATKHQQERQFIKSEVAKGVQAMMGRELTPEEWSSVTAIALRTDMAKLREHYTMDELENLTRSARPRHREIKHWEDQIQGKEIGDLIFHAKALGFFMATGRSKHRNLMLNAHNIAHRGGTSKVARTEAAIKEATANEVIIDRLVSLYALQYSRDADRTAVSDLMAEERGRDNANDNGIDAILHLSRRIQEQSQEDLFRGSKVSMVKGYSKDIYNPHVDVRVATLAEGNVLRAAGYVQRIDPLPKDNRDPTAEDLYVFINRHGGLTDRVTGIMSHTDTKYRGSRPREAPQIANDSQDRAMSKQQAQKYEPSFEGEAYMVPVLRQNGQIKGYRYMMDHMTRDEVLERDNRADRVLGNTMASIYDKGNSQQLNRDAIDALHNQYQKEYAINPEAFVELSDDSADPEIRENYKLLPEETKTYMKKVWGTDSMMVHRDHFNVTFGYRKFRVTDAFREERREARMNKRLDNEDLTPGEITDEVLVKVAEQLLGKKAGRRLRQTGDVWANIVSQVKDIWVIKNLTTLMANTSANITLLWWQGVSVKDIVNGHAEALSNFLEYQKDRRELYQLEMRLGMGFGVHDVPAAQRRVVELNDALERNPVHELIDAGLMQTIVEDIDMVDDPYSYKTRIQEWSAEKTQMVPDSMKKAARFMYMSHDTPMYKVLRNATQLSDFMARYTLHQHNTTKKKPMSRADSLQEASDAFVNYDLPTHKGLEYANSMGLVFFTKYYLRIQRHMMKMYRENPGRAIGLLAFSNVFEEVPQIMESGFWNRLYNPARQGAFEYPGAVPQILTLRAAMLPFK